ncbi:MAG TPA: ABC transporter permease [Gemmatimonadales bacterium]|nr:ABC transporter permease [Gemmatimonadales bacterium]
MTPVLRRLAWLLGRRRFEADLAEELRIHEELAAEQARHEGLSPEAAGFAARRLVGNRAQLAEAARDVWRPAALGDLSQDIRYALRGLRRQPGHAAAAIVTLTLGIGATTALFSVLDAVLLRPLPYPDPDRLVQVWEHHLPRDRRENSVSPLNFLNWIDRARSFESLAIYQPSSVSLAGDVPERLTGRAVSSSFFSVLRARPALGRLFSPGDTVAGAPKALVLSHALWKRRFGGDPGIVGTSLSLREGGATIVGVMPETFRPMADESYWEPWPMTDELRTRRGRGAPVVGRLHDRVSTESADREMKVIASVLEKEYPDFNAGWTVDVVPLQHQVTARAKPVLLLLAGAIGCVLLIACANVANLKLGQVLARRGEIAVRAALGASRGRILRQMAVEGLVLAFAGGALGVLAAVVGVEALVRSELRQIPRLAEVGVDLRILGFALLVIGAAGVVFGLAPALGLREGELRQPLGRRGGETGGAPGGRRLRGALVSFQVALSLVLLAGAGLTVRSLGNLLSQDPGFDARNLLTMDLSLSGEAYAEERRIAFSQELIGRVAALPGVAEVGLVNALPLHGQPAGTKIHVLGRPAPLPGQEPVGDISVADTGYFRAMRTPLLEGRGFTASDRSTAPNVVVVNRAFARQLLDGVSPIGQRIRVNLWEPDSIVEIVGVVGDMRRAGLEVAARPAVFYPYLQQPARFLSLVIRTEKAPEELASPVRALVSTLDRQLPILNLETMTSYVAASTDDRRYPMLLLSLLAGLAVVLSVVGLYGVLAYSVGQRSKEIGLRRALGATGGTIARLVTGEGFRFVAIGLGVGLAATLLTTRFLGRLLYGLSPTDALTLALAAGGLLVMAGLATWVPTRRALRVDPAVTLREDG